MAFTLPRGRGITSSHFPSLLALSITSALASHAAYAATGEAAESDTIVVNATADAAATQASQDYNVPATRAGTKMLMTQRDIPQSVSVVTEQRIKDQQLDSVDDVLRRTTGISTSTADIDRSTYYSRGFQINNYMFDGIPTFFESQWNFGDTQTDTAVLERIEVVRGATGLMTGAGNPSAAINMVRKHADSREFKGDVSAEYGSWDKQRYVVDVQSPLTDDGRIRGRVVTGYQDGKKWLDRYNQEKKFFYGVLDTDLTDATRFSVGYEYQQINTDSPTWGGLPHWDTEGNPVRFDRSRNTAPDWAYNDKDFQKVFLTVNQRFDNNWEATLNATHTETKFDSRMSYIDALFDTSTGDLVSRYGPSYPVVGGTGYNKGKRDVNALDLYASGPYELLGREHQLMAGANYSQQHNRYLNTWANLSPAEIGNFYDYNGNIPETAWGDLSVAQDDKIHIKSAYTATRLSLADPLHLIVGARYTKWSNDTLTQHMEKNNTSPYAGLILDINDNWSTYASYTSIFQPQAHRNIDGKYLTPTTGNNYELGVKSDWMNSRLTTSLAVFRIEQDNLAVSTGETVRGTANETAYESVDGTVSKGVEFEINGALTDNWQMTFGATRYVAEDNEGKAVAPNLPRTTVNMFTSYRLPMMPDLTLGGGINWQNRVYRDVSTTYGTFRAEQGSYALVDLFGRYQVTKALSVQANVNNLFDKEYDIGVSNSYIYGAPRSFSVSANYRF